MRRVAVLFAATPSVYDALPGLDVYNAARDARTFPGGMPVVAHPPCAQWGRLRAFARDDQAERDLAPWALDQVQRWGGVLEHPFASVLWRHRALPAPGTRDRFGGFSLPVNQNWFGHRARKPTLLYVVGLEPRALPPFPLSIAEPTATIETEIRGRPGALPAVSRRERSATPPQFAEWLVKVARSTRTPELEAAA